ncbi:GbsR/MarR family transcriptional regulator [Labilithrix luteola]|nr:MarR family transcriptional regulator [Labilithrix luteola]
MRKSASIPQNRPQNRPQNGEPARAEAARAEAARAPRATAARASAPTSKPQPSASQVDPVQTARAAMLDGVGREIAASFPGITRLGGQIVAALYLEGAPLSMDELSEMLGRSKSNVFANLRALEAAGIAVRQRASGTRHDTFALRGKYPDVVVGAYLSRLRRVVVDKVSLCNRSLELLGEAEGDEADALRDKLTSLRRKYERFATVFADIVPMTDGPVDLEEIIDAVPETMMQMLAAMAKRALARSPSSPSGTTTSGEPQRATTAIKRP